MPLKKLTPEQLQEAKNNTTTYAFSFLGINELLTVRRVCKNWKELADKTNLWARWQVYQKTGILVKPEDKPKEIYLYLQYLLDSPVKNYQDINENDWLFIYKTGTLVTKYKKHLLTHVKDLIKFNRYAEAVYILDIIPFSTEEDAEFLQNLWNQEEKFLLDNLGSTSESDESDSESESEQSYEKHEAEENNESDAEEEHGAEQAYTGVREKIVEQLIKSNVKNPVFKFLVSQ